MPCIVTAMHTFKGSTVLYFILILLIPPFKAGRTGVIIRTLYMGKPRLKEVRGLAPGLRSRSRKRTVCPQLCSFCHLHKLRWSPSGTHRSLYPGPGRFITSNCHFFLLPKKKKNATLRKTSEMNQRSALRAELARRENRTWNTLGGAGMLLEERVQVLETSTSEVTPADR